MKVVHKYAHKYQVNDLAFTRDGKMLLQCTGQGARGRGGTQRGLHDGSRPGL